MEYAKQNLEPLFEDVFWSRPERSDQTQGVVLVGGNRDSIKAPLAAFGAAQDAGAGDVTVCLPDILKKDLGNMPGIVYCQTNPSGSLGVESENTILALLGNSSVLVLTGDTGKSSETSQLLENLINKTGSQLVVTSGSLDLLLERPGLHTRKHTTLVMNSGQFQKLVTNLGHTQAYKHDMPLAAFSELLRDISSKIEANIIVLHSGHIWVLVGGSISATKRPDLTDETVWANSLAARVSVFLSYGNINCFESLTSAVFDENNIS